MDTHFLAIEQALIERLNDNLDVGVRVLTHIALPEVGSGALPPPAVVVLYGGGEVAEARPDGRAVRVSQDWVVLVISAQIQDLDAAPTAAGPMADAVLGLLMGWWPPLAAKPLRLTALPPPEYVNGNQWLPLTFTTEIVRRVEPGI